MRGYLVASGIAGSSQRSGAPARRRLSADRYVAQRRKREKSAVEQVKIMPARERPLPLTLRPTDLTPADTLLQATRALRGVRPGTALLAPGACSEAT